MSYVVGLLLSLILGATPDQDLAIRQILREVQVADAIKLTLHKQVEQEQRKHPELPGTTWNELDKTIEGPEIENDLVEAWRGVYTPSELTQILTFVRTPVGKKFWRNQASVQQRMGAASGLNGFRLYSVLQRLHPDKYPKDGQTETQMKVLFQQLRTR